MTSSLSMGASGREFTNIWNDQLGDVQSSIRPVSEVVQETYRDTPFVEAFLRRDRVCELHARIQLDHQWNPLTEVHFHMHYEAMALAAAPRNVRMSGYYVLFVPGEVCPPLSGWTPWTADVPIVAADLNVHRISHLFTATPSATAKASTFLRIYVTRQGGTAEDTYSDSKPAGTAAANLCIFGLDAHKQVIRAGTRTEF